jgi:antitoxin CptB
LLKPNQQTHLAKLRWHCRRGMLELDVLLGNYLSQRYQTASVAEQKTFERLLGFQDQELYQWFTGQTQPPDAELIALVEQMRQQKLKSHDCST